MAEAPGWIGEAETDGRLVVSAGGVWTVAGAAALERAVAALAPAPAQEVRFDMSAVERVDTAGVFLLREAARRYEAAGATVAFEGIRETSRPLFDLVAGNEGREPPKAPSRNAVVAAVERLGRTTVDGVL